MSSTVADTPATQALMQRIVGRDAYADFVPELPDDLQGWNSNNPAFDEVISRLRPKIIVEVGVWKGGSAIHMAQLLQKYGIDGTIIAIDVFLGSYDPPYNAMYPWRHGRPMLYEQFLSNVVHRKLENYIIPMAQMAQTGLATLTKLNITADLVHIDAGHEYENVKPDLEAAWRLVRPGGCVMADDFDPSWPGVVRAVNEVAESHKIEVFNRRPKALLWKPA